ncbi:MAG: rhomboid family intramembrane serine protease [Omnitrophica WOR_2 bacterium]
MTDEEEKKRLYSSALITVGIVSLLWLIKSIELIFDISFAGFGILPLKAEGLKGILFAPLVHGSIAHLVSNSIPMFLLGTALFYYYRAKAWQIFILSWLVTGFWVWLFARGSAYHIGASGVVYALTAFHFVSGIIRKEPRLIAFTLLVTFLYGSFVWGIFPGFSIKETISWESHLMGTIAGIVLAFAYRDVGPQRKVYEWPEDEEEQEDMNKENTEDQRNDYNIIVKYERPDESDGSTKKDDQLPGNE